MTTLYDLTTEWSAVLGMFEDNDYQLTPEIQSAMQALIEQGKGKIEDAVFARRNLEHEADKARDHAKRHREEADRLEAIARQRDMAVEHINQAMTPLLQITGKVKTTVGTVYLRTNELFAFEKAPTVEWHEIPDPSCVRYREPELNKTRCKELIKAGKLPDGIIPTTSESISVCIKTPSTKKKGEQEQ